MSNYLPTIWKNNVNPALNATNLNHLEAGVKNAHDEIEDMITGATPVGHATQALVARSVDPATRLTVGGVYMWVDTSGTTPVGYLGV